MCICLHAFHGSFTPEDQNYEIGSNLRDGSIMAALVSEQAFLQHLPHVYMQQTFLCKNTIATFFKERKSFGLELLGQY